MGRNGVFFLYWSARQFENDIKIVRGIVIVKYCLCADAIAAFHALMEDHIFLFCMGIDSDRSHHATARIFPIARIDVNVPAPQAEGTVIPWRGSGGWRNILPAMLTSETFVYYTKPFILERHVSVSPKDGCGRRAMDLRSSPEAERQ